MTSSSAPKAIYRDVREYLEELDRRSLLRRVTRTTNKDTEVMPLVRWQFRGLNAEQRTGWLFENLTDSRGRSFDASLAVAIVGASAQVYAAAIGVDSPDKIGAKWLQAEQNPLPPVTVTAADAPVKENIITGDDLLKTGGIDALPIPVVNPGTDSSAYFSAPVWIAKDPETGVYNAGTYRAMLKSGNRTGVLMLSGQDERGYWDKYRRLGKPMPAVLILAPPPALALCSVNKLNISEYDAAGALNGAPLELVQAETVDLLIPARAEIAIEGHIRTDLLEMEGPFGEFGGYVGAEDYQMIFEVTAITHRTRPILQAFISEMPPSESSCLRKFGFEGFLEEELRLKSPNMRKVTLPEIAGSLGVAIISFHNPVAGEVWNTLRAAAASRNIAAWKWVIAIDDDIDPNDLESVLWAMSWRVQPHRDVQIQRGRNTDLDPSGAPVEAPFTDRTFPDGLGGSQILIDATRNWAYPPVALPTKEFMDNARTIWEEELKDMNLPPLTSRVPWHGYPLGYWPEHWARVSKRAVEGQYLETGKEYEHLRTLASYFEDGVVRKPDA
jgi:4-hydroxy-3-polyprenylbenzoate decarboxylase